MVALQTTKTTHETVMNHGTKTIEFPEFQIINTNFPFAEMSF